MRDVQTHKRERDDYSDGKGRKTEKTERKRKKGEAGIGRGGEIRREESERGEGESNVSECTAMERL